MRADLLLHLGRAPWQWLQPVLGHTDVTLLMDLLYYVWIPFVTGLVYWQAWSLDRAQRMRFFLTYTVGWILLGTVLATLLSSAGPCFYAAVTGTPSPYAPLMAYLHGVDQTNPLISLEVQGILLHEYQMGHVSPWNAISAMPSIHVAMPVVFTMLAWQTDRHPGRGLRRVRPGGVPGVGPPGLALRGGRLRQRAHHDRGLAPGRPVRVALPRPAQPDGRVTGTTSVDPVGRRHWSDFVGVLCYTVLAVNIALGSRELGLLILPSLVHELLVAAAFILRGPARRITVGVVPRAVGYLHTFLIIGFLQFAAVSHPEWITASSNETARLAGLLPLADQLDPRDLAALVPPALVQPRARGAAAGHRPVPIGWRGTRSTRSTS